MLDAEGETWRGSGRDPSAALADALTRAVPSPRLRTQWLSACLPADPAVAGEASQAASKNTGASADSGVRAPARSAARILRRVDLPGDAGTGSATRRRGSGGRAREASEVHVEPEQVLAAVDRVGELLNDVVEAEPRMALQPPQVIRLASLAWIAEARALEEEAPRPEVGSAVARVARELSRQSAQYWPGSVSALQLHQTPASVGREFALAGPAGEPRTWRELQHAAAEARDVAAARGWADDAALEPPPEDSRRTFDRCWEWLEARTGPMVGDAQVAEPYRQGLHGLGGGLIQVARKLRWLRGRLPDPLRWGMAMGRMRWLAYGREALGLVLDPSFAPRPDWATEVGRDPQVIGRQRRRDELLGATPASDAPPAAWEHWLAEALELASDAEILQQIAGAEEGLLALDSAQWQDLGMRRRLQRLQRQVRGGSEG